VEISGSSITTFVHEVLEGEGDLYGMGPLEAIAKAVTWSTSKLAAEYSKRRELQAKIEADFAEGERVYWRTHDEAVAKANAAGKVPEVDPTKAAIEAGGKCWESWRNKATLLRYAASSAQEVLCNVSAVVVGIGRELERRYASVADPRPAGQVKALAAAAQAEERVLDLEKMIGEQRVRYNGASSLQRASLEATLMKTIADRDEAAARRSAALAEARRFSWFDLQ